ncbi:MAG: c-type cytochrome [Gammaproteobacteria bacterium]|nr:c-type cytochrome [Gammaproteobacteria bacterium]
MATSLVHPVTAFEPIRPLPQSIDHLPALVALGKKLFFEPALSADGTVSCASCHAPEFGWADPRPVSIGVHGRTGSLNAPTVLNAYFNFRQFWNGRAGDLQEQAAGPIHNPVEMDMSPEAALRRLRQDPSYDAAFAAAFPGVEWDFSHVTRAIAEFEKTLITPNSRLDRYLRGEIQLTASESEGYRLFKQLGCVTCHNGINIGGNSYQYMGALIPTEIDAAGADRYALTGNEFDRNRFKVPTLRNILQTAPYLHDGSQSDLKKIVELMGYHNLGFRLKDEEADLILVFFQTLTGETPEIAHRQ